MTTLTTATYGHDEPIRVAIPIGRDEDGEMQFATLALPHGGVTPEQWELIMRALETMRPALMSGGLEVSEEAQVEDAREKERRMRYESLPLWEVWFYPASANCGPARKLAYHVKSATEAVVAAVNENCVMRDETDEFVFANYHLRVERLGEEGES